MSSITVNEVDVKNFEENGNCFSERGQLVTSPSSIENGNLYIDGEMVTSPSHIEETKLEQNRTEIETLVEVASSSDTGKQPNKEKLGGTEPVAVVQTPDGNKLVDNFKTILKELDTCIVSSHAVLHEKQCTDPDCKVSRAQEKISVLIKEDLSEKKDAQTKLLKIQIFKKLKEVLKSLNEEPPTKEELCKRERRKINNINELEPGIEVGFGRFGYKHHAVVIKVQDRDYDTFHSMKDEPSDLNTFTIVHLTGDSRDSFKGSSSSSVGQSKASPAITTETFKRSLNISAYTYSNALHANIAVYRAEMIPAIHDKLGGYHIFNYNCQHFSSFCVTGQFFSKKVGRICRCCPRVLNQQINYDLRLSANETLFQYILQKVIEAC